MEKSLLKVTLVDGREVLINEVQVCTIKPDNGNAVVTMSDGEKLVLSSPTFEEWMNDFLSRSY